MIALTRKTRPEWMAVNTEYPSACFASGWRDYLKEKVTLRPKEPLICLNVTKKIIVDKCIDKSQIK